MGGIEAHLPTDVRGVDRVADRRVISGIIHVLKSAWRLPAHVNRRTYDEIFPIRRVMPDPAAVDTNQSKVRPRAPDFQRPRIMIGTPQSRNRCGEFEALDHAKFVT